MKNNRKILIGIFIAVCTIFVNHQPSQAQNSPQMLEAKRNCYARYTSSVDIANCIRRVNRAYNYNPRRPQSDWSEDQWQRYEERLQRNVDAVRYRPERGY